MVPWNDGNPLGISQPQARSIFNPLAVLGVRHLLALQLGHAALMHKFVVIPPSVALPVSIALLAFHALKGELSRGGLIMALGVTISAAHIGMLPLSVWTGLTLIPISIILGCLRVAQSSSWAASTLAEPYLAVLGDELKAYWNMAREWRAFLREAAYSCRNSDDACLAYGEKSSLMHSSPLMALMASQPPEPDSEDSMQDSEKCIVNVMTRLPLCESVAPLAIKSRKRWISFSPQMNCR